MSFLRSTLFNLCFYVITASMAVLASPFILADRLWLVRAMELWARTINRLLPLLVDIRIEIRGREHYRAAMESGSCIIASKHQSAWDTFVWHNEVEDPAIVMKKELLSIPFYGWISQRVGMLAVDRKAGASALRRLVGQARERVASGRPIVIFPQGTRAPAGAGVEDVPYQPGTAALYGQLKVPVVPVALNSGLFWRRHSWLRRPGTIVLEYQPPIPPGLKRREFEARLVESIESATARLEAEGAGTAVHSL